MPSSLYSTAQDIKPVMKCIDKDVSPIIDKNIFRCSNHRSRRLLEKAEARIIGIHRLTEEPFLRIRRYKIGNLFRNERVAYVIDP